MRPGIVVQLKEDDERFSLQAGDLLAVTPYTYEPDTKYTVIERLSDGFDPECNVYRSQVKYATKKINQQWQFDDTVFKTLCAYNVSSAGVIARRLLLQKRAVTSQSVAGAFKRLHQRGKIKRADYEVWATIVLRALDSATRSGSSSASARAVARETPQFIGRTASGQLVQPMGERRVRKILNKLCEEVCVTRSRSWGTPYMFRLTDIGRAVIR